MTDQQNHHHDRPKGPEFTAAIDRPLVGPGEHRTRHVVVRFRAPNAEGDAGERTPMNLGLVIDRSGSMAGMPLEAAKDAARQLSDRLVAPDRLSLVCFGSDVRTHLAGVVQDGAARAESQRAIDAVRIGGCTNLSGGWLSGCRAVAESMDSGGTAHHRVILLSDGKGNQGICEPSELARHAAALRDRGLVSSAIGIGPHYCNRQLEAIAGHGGGMFHHAAEPSDIADIVTQELAETAATTVDAVQIQLRAPDGVEVSVLGDWSHSRVAGAVVCDLGPMAGGVERTMVFRLRFPDDAAGAEWRCVAGGWWRASGDSEQRSLDPIEIVARYAAAEVCETQPIDNDLGVAVLRAWKSDLTRRAIALNQEGLLWEAGEVLEQEWGSFCDYAGRLRGGEAFLRPIDELRRTVRRPYSRVQAKEMLVAGWKQARGERDFRRSDTGRSGWPPVE